MKERIPKLNWQEIEDSISCPFSFTKCKKGEGIKKYEKRIEHDTTIYVVECKFCGKKAMEWGYDQFSSQNDYSLNP